QRHRGRRDPDPSLPQGYVYGPVGAAHRELPGTVERINDPDSSRRQPEAIVDLLFRQHRVIWSLLGQTLEDEIVGPLVGEAPQLPGAVGRPVEVGPNRKDQLSGFVRELTGERGIRVEREPLVDQPANRLARPSERCSRGIQTAYRPDRHSRTGETPAN